MKEREELLNEKGDAVRECKATHEENFWSNWLREDGREKEEITAKAEENDEGKGEKRKKVKRRKKRTKRGELKEDVKVLFRWRLLKSLVKGEIWRVVVIFLGETFWMSRKSLGECGLD